MSRKRIMWAGLALFLAGVVQSDAQPLPPRWYVKASVANEAALPTCNAAANGHIRVAVAEASVNYCNGSAWANVGDGGSVAADEILESHLKAVDAAADEECLTYESTVGDFEWQACGSAHGDGANCAAGEIPLGVDASGAVQGCFEPSEADISDLSHTVDTNLTDEEVQDKAGAMATGNTETGITVTYQDGDGTIDYVAEVTQSEFDTHEGNANIHHAPDGTGTDDQVAAEVPYTVDDTNEWAGGDPTEVDGALEHLAPRVLANDAKVTAHGDGANCAAGEIPLGTDADGAAQGCYEPSEADISDLAHAATGIQDGLIVEVDLDEDSGTPTDADVLTYDSTGANFNWIAQSGVAAGTAAALAANGGNCAAGEIALGVDAAGAVEGCYEPSESDISDLSHTVDTDTQLSDEQVQDKAGAMVTGNTETGIAVTYQDADGTIDYVAEVTQSEFDTHEGNASIHHAATVDTNTNASTECAGGQFYEGDGSCTDVLEELELNTLVELNIQIADATLEEDTHVTEHAENGADELLGEAMGTACTDGQILKANATGGLDCGADATGAGGSAITFDIGDDGGDDSVDVNEIATSGDTNSVFTEPSADKILVTLSNNWPGADTADALSANGGNCGVGNYPLGVDAAGAVEGCTADDDQPDNDSEVPDAISVVAGSVSDTPIVLDIEAADQTADGDIDYDTTEEVIEVGDDGVATHKFSPDSVATAHHADSILESELTSLAELNTQITSAVVTGPHDGTGTDDQVAAEVPYTVDDTNEWAGADPTEVDGALEHLAPRVLANDAKVTAHGNGANCAAGEIPLGVGADGAVEGCYEPSEADISDLAHTATAVTDGLIVEADLNEDSGTPTDADVLTYDSTGANFNWLAQSGIAAGTAAALAANGGNCAAGEIALGVDAAGAVEGCYEPSEADISDLSHTADTNLTEEEVDDFAGPLVATGGTKTRISITYQDGTDDMDFVVDDMNDDQPDDDSEVPDAISVVAGSISDTPIVLDLEAADQTADGDIDYDTTEEVIEVGDDGVGTHKFSPDSVATAHHADSILESELTSLAELNTQIGSAVVTGPHDGTGTDDQVAAEVPYTVDDTNEWAGADPTEVDGALEHLAPRVLANDAKVTAHGNGANCAAGEIPLGTDADGAVEGCYEPSEADISDLAHTATGITDGLIVEADLNEDSGTPTDGDLLEYDSTGANFNWIAQSGVAAGTAAALAANGSNCAAGEIALGVDAAGAVEGCYEPSEADISDLSHTADTNLTEEEVDDFAGPLVATGGTKTRISITYQDGTDDMDFVVDDMNDDVPESGDFGNGADLDADGGISDNAVGLVQMAGGTDGNLITYDASGDPAAVTTGTSGQVLTSNGAGTAPTFQATADTNAVKEYNWTASALLPLDTDDAIPPILKEEGSNIDILVRAYDASTDECASGTLHVPSDVESGSTITFRSRWYSPTATTGNIMWYFRHLPRAEGEDWDAALTTEAASADATQGTIDQITVTTWTETLSNTGWAASELVEFELCRDANHASDTLAGDAYLIDFTVEIPRE